MRTGLLLAVAAVASAQTPSDPADVLARTRDKLRETTQLLPNYTCVQTVERRYFRPSTLAPPRSCDQIGGDKKRGKYKQELYVTDRLRLDVKISDGQEIGAWAGSKQFDSRSLTELAQGGPFQTGSLGGFIENIFHGEGVRLQYAGEEQTDSGTLFEYRFRVPVESSHYKIQLGGGWRVTAFDGAVWIDPDSFEIKRLKVQNGVLPPETLACESATTVDYQRVRLGSADYLVPQRSVLHVLMRDSMETESTATYSSCREFRGESTIHFEDLPAPADSPKSDPHVPVAVPAGLPFSLALAAPIDTGTAAAGDPVVAQVLKAVYAAGSKHIVIPAGAMVRARIVRMQHWAGHDARFEVSIGLESFEVDGVSSPLHAVWDQRDELAYVRKSPGMRSHSGVRTPPSGLPPTFATFVFPTSKDSFIVPRGYESKWLTATSP